MTGLQPAITPGRGPGAPSRNDVPGAGREFGRRADRDGFGSPPGEKDQLERVQNAVVSLLAELPRSPDRLRIRAKDIVVELNWSTPTAAPGPTGPVPATPAGPGSNSVESGIVAGGREPAGPRITAPTVGTFYRCPEPGANPFVEVGDQVKPGQQVAIVEAMKLMLPVEAETAGVILEVLVGDGQSVEYGQPLFVLGPGT